MDRRTDRIAILILHGGGMAEWLASPNWDRKVVGSNPGVARSDGQRWNL